MPTYIRDGNIITVQGPKKPPMTRTHYEAKCAELWELDGMITLEHILTGLKFLKIERDKYVATRFDGMPE